MRRLDLVPIYYSGRPTRPLAAELEERLLVEVRERQAWFDPELAFDSGRGQYGSTELLRLLLSDCGAEEAPRDIVLGVASVDLFAPVLTYVFGEAQLDGRAAVVSGHRLRPEAYGLPANETLFFERLLKESIHELGHVLGLVHCVDAGCVMHVSTYVEDIDVKPASYCSPCLEIVRAAVRAGGAPGPAESRRI